jgi:hypothetical protein
MKQDERDEQDLRGVLAWAGRWMTWVDATKFYKSCPSESGTPPVLDIEAA